MKTMGDIFREAARRVEQFSDTYSCSAVKHVAEDYGHHPAIAKQYYVRLIAPARAHWYLNTCDFDFGEPAEKARAHRVVALCLAAVLADDGDGLEDL